MDNYKPGEKGLEFGQPAHVLDAAEITQECWDELSVDTIVGCWRRANCLPINHYDFESAPGDTASDSPQQLALETETINEIVHLIDSKNIYFFLYFSLDD